MAEREAIAAGHKAVVGSPESEDQLRRQFEDQLTEKIGEWIDHTRADREQRIRDLPELIERELGITGPDVDE